MKMRDLSSMSASGFGGKAMSTSAPTASSAFTMSIWYSESDTRFSGDIRTTSGATSSISIFSASVISMVSTRVYSES